MTPVPRVRNPSPCFSRGQAQSPTVKCYCMVPIPLTDHIRRRTFWTFTLLLIVTNFWAFFIELSLGPHLNRFILLNGLIPARYSLPPFSTFRQDSPWLPFLFPCFCTADGYTCWETCSFSSCSGAALKTVSATSISCCSTWFPGRSRGSPNHRQPRIPRPHHRCQRRHRRGAGRVFYLLPRSPHHHAHPAFHFFWTVQVPALLLLGYWFLIQFVAGFQMLSIQTATAGGVAWWAISEALLAAC